LDGVYDSRANRKAIFNRGMIPNIPANPRGRKTPKRGLFSDRGIQPIGSNLSLDAKISLVPKLACSGLQN
jgi:hypothetical protein